MTKEHFVSLDAAKMDKVLQWLNALVGKVGSRGEIVRVIHWQVVPTGRPYEYSAFAQVEIKRD